MPNGHRNSYRLGDIPSPIHTSDSEETKVQKHRWMVMSTAPPPSANSAAHPVDGKDPKESVALSKAAQQVGSASASASSAEQVQCNTWGPFKIQLDLVHDAVKDMRSAAQLPDASAARPEGPSEERAVPDERGEEQPKKRCKHNLMTVSAEDFMIPDILQPIQTAIAREIDSFNDECQQWDPPNFEEDATDKDKPIFRLRNVCQRLHSSRPQGVFPQVHLHKQKRCML